MYQDGHETREYIDGCRSKAISCEAMLCQRWRKSYLTPLMSTTFLLSVAFIFLPACSPSERTVPTISTNSSFASQMHGKTQASETVRKQGYLQASCPPHKLPTPNPYHQPFFQFTTRLLPGTDKMIGTGNMRDPPSQNGEIPDRGEEE